MESRTFAQFRENLGYENGKIYILRNSVNSDEYVGATKQTLYSRWLNGWPWLHEIEEVGYDNWTMTVLELYPCSCWTELRARELMWIRRLSPKLNGETKRKEAIIARIERDTEWISDSKSRALARGRAADEELGSDVSDSPAPNLYDF